jgi:ribonuclease HI
MGQLGFTGRLYDFVKAFLSNRSLTVRVAGSVSKSYNVNMGVPQGSVIAPLLFSLMLHDIEQVKDAEFHFSIYADDIAIWATCPKVRKFHSNFMKKYQLQIDKITQYMDVNGFRLSSEKTVLMVFDSRKRIPACDYHINISGNRIDPSKETKFLGVTITSSLQWETHMRNLKAKALRAVGLIKTLSNETWCTADTLVHLTGALVRSRLMYGKEVFLTASDTAWQDLQVVELKALKIALGVCKSAATFLVYQEANWLPLKDQCKLETAYFQARAHASPTCVKNETSSERNDHGRRMRLSSKPTILKKTSPITEETKDLWVDITPEMTKPNPQPNFAPWIRERAQISSKFEGDPKKSDNPLLLATLAKEKIATELNSHLQIFTDGSILDTGETGCSFVIPSLGIKREYKLDPGVSIFTAEMYAILMACTFVNDLPVCPKGIAILSDSKSALQALERGGTNNSKDLQEDILVLIHQIICKGTDVRFQWIPSHTGIRGNDAADQAAKHAAQNGIPAHVGLSLSDVKRKLKATARSQWEAQRNQKCLEKGWLYLPNGKRKLPKLPRRLQKIILRLRTACPRFRYNRKSCPCGAHMSLEHITEYCDHHPSQLSPIWDFRRKWKLKVTDFLVPHDKLGIEPMKILATHIANSDASEWI